MSKTGDGNRSLCSRFLTKHFLYPLFPGFFPLYSERRVLLSNGTDIAKISEEVIK
jgi:hypothetical protein